MTVTVKNKTRTPLVVPPSVRRRAGHKNGEDLEFRVSGGVITIIPRRPTAYEYTPAERRAIDRGIAQSEKEYREGKNAGPFDTVEAFAASMEADIRKLRKARRKAESAR
jgi:bifunctional DNA-binding transcriptional regulator/antitoxin component of YhaV-PrlF toxin-antitoxin module